jgi:hypothetical protein
MPKKKSDQQLIIQALNAAETNIKLAKQLLTGGSARGGLSIGKSSRDIPGIVGVFDGENMVAEDGKKYKVNPNYASKSVLVYGDTLKRIEVDGKERFKQIERVKRQKVEGILAKKGGRFVAVTPDGSYEISQVAVDYYGGKEGDEVIVVLPQRDKNVPYVAVESIKKEKPSSPSRSGPSDTSVTSRKPKRKPTARKKVAPKKPATRKKAEDTEKKEPEPKEKKITKTTPIEGDEELR